MNNIELLQTTLGLLRFALHCRQRTRELVQHIAATDLQFVLTALEFLQPQLLLFDVLKLTLEFFQLGVGFLNLFTKVFGIILIQVEKRVGVVAKIRWHKKSRAGELLKPQPENSSTNTHRP